MSRVLAIDFGKKRTGIAVTDDFRMIASGLTTVATPELLPFLKDYFSKENVEIVIFGEPKRMNNEPSEITPLIEKFIEKFTAAFPTMKVERMDERFTSKMAFQTMIDSGLKKKQRQNKALVDEIAATIILQDYLGKK
ncbi:Holliday junction resolvase RuvX [Flavobacterium sp. HSC-61S13]|uniref:Holliday junction resolvase RuvX n=1 Tax=Flavobacterium sp. HSC-61S13 TaxID=2910963 RepID=UPI00209F335C|nr:putative Holliday junction resolvase [Flavobacterium sp. HSC-61S13]